LHRPRSRATGRSREAWTATRITTLPQGEKAHTANRASKTADRYTASAHEINITAIPTHLSIGASSRLVARRIVSYKLCRPPGVGGERRAEVP